MSVSADTPDARDSQPSATDLPLLVNWRIPLAQSGKTAPHLESQAEAPPRLRVVAAETGDRLPRPHHTSGPSSTTGVAAIPAAVTDSPATIPYSPVSPAASLTRGPAENSPLSHSTDESEPPATEPPMTIPQAHTRESSGTSKWEPDTISADDHAAASHGAAVAPSQAVTEARTSREGSLPLAKTAEVIAPTPQAGASPWRLAGGWTKRVRRPGWQSWLWFATVGVTCISGLALFLASHRKSSSGLNGGEEVYEDLASQTPTAPLPMTRVPRSPTALETGAFDAVTLAHAQGMTESGGARVEQAAGYKSRGAWLEGTILEDDVAGGSATPPTLTGWSSPHSAPLRGMTPHAGNSSSPATGGITILHGTPSSMPMNSPPVTTSSGAGPQFYPIETPRTTSGPVLTAPGNPFAGP